MAGNVDDASSFDRTKQALHFIGFDQQSQQSIFAAVSAVLHVGNLMLGRNEHGDATLQDDRHLVAVSGLLKVEGNDVRSSFCNRLITAGTDVMGKPETMEKAQQARDALAKVQQQISVVAAVVVVVLRRELAVSRYCTLR